MNGARRDTDADGGGPGRAIDTGEPELFDPDEPTPAVGSWPSLDPRRLGLPPLAWLFLAGAVLIGWQSLAMSGGTPLTPGPLLNLGIGIVWGVLPLLIPAALLWRIPDAPRRLPALFAGLALTGILRAVAPYEASWAATWVAEGGPLATIVPLASQALDAAGPVLVGIGLLQLRGGRPDRLGLLAAIALVYGTGIVTPFVVVGGSFIDPVVALGGLVLWWLAGAFAVWVPVAAWLDRAPPRPFWALLAAAFPLTLITLALSVVANLATREGFGGTAADLGWIVYGLVAMAPSVLALVAYGWFTPRPSEPAESVPVGAPSPLEPARGGGAT